MVKFDNGFPAYPGGRKGMEQFARAQAEAARVRRDEKDKEKYDAVHDENPQPNA